MAVRPVTATRIAMNRSPAFQPRASARARSGGSSSSASKETSPTATIASRAAASPSRVVVVSQRFGTSVTGSRATSLTHRNPTRSPMAPSVGRRSPMIGRRPRSSSSDGIQSIRPAASSASTNGRSRSTRSSGSSRRIHWPFSHSSRSRSKTAPPLWTVSSLNRSTISSIDRTSSSVPVAQPRSAR